MRCRWRHCARRAPLQSFGGLKPALKRSEIRRAWARLPRLRTSLASGGRFVQTAAVANRKGLRVSDSLRFGRIEVWPRERQLRVDGVAASVGARAFDLLLALIERRDRLVTKSELLELVWPGVVVEENNLQVQISALRKLLGPQVIATIPGRGYRFSAALNGEAHVDAVAAADAQPVRSGAPAPAARRSNLPTELAVLYGRDDELRALRRLLEEHRLVTVVGAGRHRQEPAGAGRRARVDRALSGRRVDGRTRRSGRACAASEYRGRGARHRNHRRQRARRTDRRPRAEGDAARARQLRTPARRRRGAGGGDRARRAERHAAGDQPGTAARARGAAVPAGPAGRAVGDRGQRGA